MLKFHWNIQLLVAMANAKIRVSATIGPTSLRRPNPIIYMAQSVQACKINGSQAAARRVSKLSVSQSALWQGTDLSRSARLAFLMNPNGASIDYFRPTVREDVGHAK